MTWFTEFLLRADASRRGRRASIRRSPGDTVQYNINGQLMNVVIPANLKAGDTFEVSVPPSTRDGRAAIDGVLVGCVASS